MEGGGGTMSVTWSNNFDASGFSFVILLDQNPLQKNASFQWIRDFLRGRLLRGVKGMSKLDPCQVFFLLAYLHLESVHVGVKYFLKSLLFYVLFV